MNPRLSEIIQTYKAYLGWWIIGLGILMVSLIFAAFIVPLQSDMVVVQSVVHSIRVNGLGSIYLSPDTFILKMPIYWLFDIFHLNGSLGLFGISTLFNVTGFGVFGLVFAWFARTHKVRPSIFGVFFLLTCALSNHLLVHFYNPNFRNGEYALIFIFIACIGALYRHQISRKVKLLVGIPIIIFGGLLCYSDPLFLYTFFIPTLLFYSIHAMFVRFDSRSLIVITGLLSTILLGMTGGMVFSRVFHFHVVGNNSAPAFIPISILLENAQRVLSGSLNLFDANFFGLTVLKIGTFIVLMNAGLFGLMSVWLFQVLRRHDPENKKQPSFVHYIGWLALASPIVYLLSQSTVEVNYRYLVSTYFFLPMVAAFAVSRIESQRVKMIMIVGFLAVICVNLGHTALEAKHAIKSKVADRSTNYSEIQQIIDFGATKGYAPYWQAGLFTYLSDYKISSIASVCQQQGIAPYSWWINDRERIESASKTFLIVDTKNTTCFDTDIKTQFGEPTKRIDLSEDKVLYLFDRDITTDLRDPVSPVIGAT